MSRASGALAAAQDALLGPAGEPLLELMLDLGFDRPGSADPAAVALARSLGWVDPARAPLRLTTLGAKVTDSIREFTLWHERAGALHAQDQHRALHPSSFAGQRVLEVGSGSGCNLLSVREAARRAIGIDVEPVYLGLSHVLSRRFKAPLATAACAAAEQLPFAEGSFDTVLCLGSLQYTDIPVAISEMGRVLAPNGRAIVVLATFSQLLGHLARDLRPRHTRRLVRRARTVVNTVGVELAGRRLLQGRGPSATASPVYPTRARLEGHLRDAGLAPCGDPVAISQHDTVFVAERRGAV